MSILSRSRPATPRPGLSLAEIAVVIALLGMIGATIGSALLHQQRFYGDASEQLQVRGGVRDAMEILSADIRGSSPADTLRLWADSAVELFTTIGTSVVCRTATSTAFALADESDKGSALSSFLLYPDSGDLALLYRDVPDASGSRWERHRIAAFAPRLGGAGCLLYDGDPVEGFALTLRSPPTGVVRAGAPIRFLRRGRYSLYRSSDADWYLGYRRCNAIGVSSCSAIQPVSGPYRRYSSDASETGFLFEYFDARGARVPGGGPPLDIARIDVTSRAKGRSPIRIGTAEAVTAVSATASIAIRNR